MGMSLGGNEGLFKMAESAAPEEGRIMPAERVYLKTDKTVDLGSAIALLKSRKKDPSQRIAGGLDDNSDKVRKISKKSPVSRETSEVEAAEESTNSASLTDDNVDKTVKNTQLKEPSSSKRLTGRYTTGDLMSELFKLQHQVDQLLRNKPAAKEVVKSESEEPDYLAALLKGRHRVTFQINGMEFSVACLSMINDPSTHCLVLCFDDQSDSFFTPPVQSELTIKYDGEQIPGKLFYFGMSFRLREVGLRFLGFLNDGSNTVTASL